MKKDYIFLEHTADIMFEAYGKDYPEAFENAAKAMLSIIGSANETESEHFIIKATNIEELTVCALADLLAFMDANEMVFSRIKVKKFAKKEISLEFDAYGERKMPRDSVKAVTYHELMVNEDEKGWKIRILLDV